MEKFWKNNKGLIIGIGIVLLLILFTILQGLEKEPAEPFKVDESQLSSEMVSWYNDTKSDEYVVTVMGMTTCPHCQNYKPVIEEIADNENIKLYFFEVDTFTNSYDEEVLTNAYVLEGYEGSVPYTFITKNGEFIVDTTGGMDKDATTSFLRQNNVIE